MVRFYRLYLGGEVGGISRLTSRGWVRNDVRILRHNQYQAKRNPAGAAASGNLDALWFPARPRGKKVGTRQPQNATIKSGPHIKYLKLHVAMAKPHAVCMQRGRKIGNSGQIKIIVQIWRSRWGGDISVVHFFRVSISRRRAGRNRANPESFFRMRDLYFSLGAVVTASILSVLSL